MNNNGFSIILVVILVQMLLVGIDLINSIRGQELDELKLRMEIEIANITRNQIEKNTDRVIKQFLKKELSEKNLNNQIIKSNIILKLLDYFNETESKFGNVSFSINSKKLTEKSLSDNIEIFTARTEVGGIGVFIFHGEKRRSNILVGDINIGKVRQKFRIISQYTITEEILWQ